MLRGATMRWTNTWYSETGISFGWKAPIGLNTDFTFLTFTKFFLQSSRGSERFSHFFYWHKSLLDATVGIVLEIMVRMYDTTVENYNFNLEKNLIHQVFFCLCLNVIWLKLHPVIFSLESVWKNDFDIVHVLLRAVHRQHVQSAMQRYQARWLLCLTSRCLGSNFRAGMYLVCSLISEVLICCLNYF